MSFTKRLLRDVDLTQEVRVQRRHPEPGDPLTMEQAITSAMVVDWTDRLVVQFGSEPTLAEQEGDVTLWSQHPTTIARVAPYARCPPLPTLRVMPPAGNVCNLGLVRVPGWVAFAVYLFDVGVQESILADLYCNNDCDAERLTAVRHHLVMSHAHGGGGTRAWSYTPGFLDVWLKNRIAVVNERKRKLGLLK